MQNIIIINVRSARASGLIASGSKIKMHLMIPLFRIELKDLSISGQFLLTLGGGEIINIHTQICVDGHHYITSIEFAGFTVLILASNFWSL